MNGVGLALTLLGMMATGVGAWIAARAVIISDEEAEKLTAAPYGTGNRDMTEALRKQSRSARNGLYLVTVGTALQFIGTLAGALA